MKIWFSNYTKCQRDPWNKGQLIGQKPPLQPKHVWSIRTQLQLIGKTRDLALFNLAIDSKLRGVDVVALRASDIAPHGYAIDRATIRQKKTNQPIKFELSEHTRSSFDEYLKNRNHKGSPFLFYGNGGGVRQLSTRQYARLVKLWVEMVGLSPKLFGTHSLHRTKAAIIYRKTGNLRAVQLLLGHTKIEGTVRYLGIEVDDAHEIAEKVEV